MSTNYLQKLGNRVKEIYSAFDIIRNIKRITTKKFLKERLTMKNDKNFDGDKIYAMSVTLFAGALSIGFVLMAAIEKIF